VLNDVEPSTWRALGRSRTAQKSELSKVAPSLSIISPHSIGRSAALLSLFLNRAPSFSAELSQLGLRSSHVSSVNQITPLPFFALSGRRLPPYLRPISHFIFTACRLSLWIRNWLRSIQLDED
jgi:hypothetical protein